MQLRNYSILSTKSAENLLANRYKRTPYSKKNYVKFKYGQIIQKPHQYFLYKDLNSTKATLAPMVKSFSNSKDALLASNKLAKNEALHPEQYGLSTGYKTLSGKIKKFDRIDAGKHHLKFNTPQSSNNLFNHNKALNMTKRNHINQKRNAYTNIIKHRYYGNDNFRKNRAIAYQRSLQILNHRYPLKRRPQQMNFFNEAKVENHHSSKVRNLFNDESRNENKNNLKAYLKHHNGITPS